MSGFTARSGAAGSRPYREATQPDVGVPWAGATLLPGGREVALERSAGRSAGPSAGGKRFVMADGRQAHVRPVRPSDAVAERAFVESLSLGSRRRRFHGAMAQLPMSLARAMTEIDFHQQVALVAEAPASDGAMRLVADARYVRQVVEPDDGPVRHAVTGTSSGGADTPRDDAAPAAGDGGAFARTSASAEFAIAVADDWQGHGLGRWLLGELAWHARLAGVATLHGSVLLDNAPMLSLLSRAGARFEHDPEDARLVRAIVHL